jgi:hypothetical protein
VHNLADDTRGRRPRYRCLMSDWDADAIKELRGAVYRGDPSIVDLVVRPADR